MKSKLNLNSEIELITREEFQTLFHPIKSDQIVLIADSAIAENYPEILNTLKEQRENIHYIEISGSRNCKSFTQYQSISEELIAKGITRKSHLVCLGGGALSDLVGYVAATLYRGIKWSVIPTTILSMVDASIGGKTGIDTAQGKNLLGSFHAPERIFLYPDFINTLPQTEIDSGKGEILKYALLSKEINFRVHEKFDLGQIMDHCAQFKQVVVEKDPFEDNLRKILNLGHTFGHAFEMLTNLPHGVCVLWGIKFMDENFWDKKFREEIEFLEAKLEIGRYQYDLNMVDMLDFIKRDKKRTNIHQMDVIMLQEIGVPTIESVPMDKIRNLLCFQ